MCCASIARDFVRIARWPRGALATYGAGVARPTPCGLDNGWEWAASVVPAGWSPSEHGGVLRVPTDQLAKAFDMRPVVAETICRLVGAGPLE